VVLKKRLAAAVELTATGLPTARNFSIRFISAIHGRPGDVGGGGAAHDGGRKRIGKWQWAFDADRVQERHGWPVCKFALERAANRAAYATSFLGIESEGINEASFRTTANSSGPLCCAVGRSRPKITTPRSIREARRSEVDRRLVLPPVMMVDCSHGEFGADDRKRISGREEGLASL